LQTILKFYLRRRVINFFQFKDKNNLDFKLSNFSKADGLATLDKAICEKWSRYLALKSHFYKSQVKIKESYNIKESNL